RVSNGDANDRRFAGPLDPLRRYCDATRLRLQAVDSIGHQVLEDTPERDAVANHARQMRRQLGVELDMVIPRRSTYDVGDEIVEIAFAPLQWPRQSLVARGQRLEIGEARIDGLSSLRKHRG